MIFIPPALFLNREESHKAEMDFLKKKIDIERKLRKLGYRPMKIEEKIEENKPKNIKISLIKRVLKLCRM